jgi:hypothetical protein
MNAPEDDKKTKPEMPPSPERDRGPEISMSRKILIGLFILGFWIFFYWFRES